jgi:hypothetical protein
MKSSKHLGESVSLGALLLLTSAGIIGIISLF